MSVDFSGSAGGEGGEKRKRGPGKKTLEANKARLTHEIQRLTVIENQEMGEIQSLERQMEVKRSSGGLPPELIEKLKAEKDALYGKRLRVTELGDQCDKIRELLAPIREQLRAKVSVLDETEIESFEPEMKTARENYAKLKKLKVEKEKIQLEMDQIELHQRSFRNKYSELYEIKIDHDNFVSNLESKGEEMEKLRSEIQTHELTINQMERHIVSTGERDPKLLEMQRFHAEKKSNLRLLQGEKFQKMAEVQNLEQTILKSSNRGGAGKSSSSSPLAALLYSPQGNSAPYALVASQSYGGSSSMMMSPPQPYGGGSSSMAMMSQPYGGGMMSPPQPYGGGSSSMAMMSQPYGGGSSIMMSPPQQYGGGSSSMQPYGDGSNMMTSPPQQYGGGSSAMMSQPYGGGSSRSMPPPPGSSSYHHVLGGYHNNDAQRQSDVATAIAYPLSDHQSKLLNISQPVSYPVSPGSPSTSDAAGHASNSASPPLRANKSASPPLRANKSASPPHVSAYDGSSLLSPGGVPQTPGYGLFPQTPAADFGSVAGGGDHRGGQQYIPGTPFTQDLYGLGFGGF